MKKIIISFFSMILVLTIIFSLPVCSADENNAAKARNGVVRILSFIDNGDETVGIAFGSGFAVGEAGKSSSVFITNQHVIAGSVSVYILLDDNWVLDLSAEKLDINMDHAVKCEVIYTPDTYPDYAILQAERVVTERVALPLMSPDLAEPGESVYALGYPGVSDEVPQENNASIDAITVTKGTISRFTNIKNEGNADVIQIDAEINAGNSGGPLITEEGYVIGINTWRVGHDNNGVVEKVNVALDVDYITSRLNNLTEIGTLNGFSYTLITDRDGGINTSVIMSIFAVIVAVIAVSVIIVLTRHKSSKKIVYNVSSEENGTVQNEIYPETVPVSDAIGKTMPASALLPYRLVCESGFFSGRKFALDRPLRIGRDPKQNDLIFSPDTAGVSGIHCVLTPVIDGISLTDLGSTYGTFLSDGTKLTIGQSVTLKEGDRFSLGSQTQIFRIEKKSANSI